METTRKTGLADSFLFRRTEPDDAPQPAKRQDAPDAPGVSDVPNAPDAQEPTPRGRSRVPRPKKSQRVTLRDRCTLHIDRDVNEWLDLVARIEGKERSEVVSEILRNNLPKYRIAEG